jgi:hypothetical protein
MSGEALAANFGKIVDDYQPRHGASLPKPIAEILPLGEWVNSTQKKAWTNRKREQEAIVLEWRTIGGYSPKAAFGCRNDYAFAEIVLKVAKNKDVTPYKLLRFLVRRKGRIKNLFAYMNSSDKWLTRENDESSYYHWAENVWKRAREAG